MNRKLIIICVLLIVVIGGSFFFIQNINKETTYQELVSHHISDSEAIYRISISKQGSIGTSIDLTSEDDIHEFLEGQNIDLVNGSSRVEYDYSVSVRGQGERWDFEIRSDLFIDRYEKNITKLLITNYFNI
ncbi:hypothetical protein CR194_09625 [Salipaludibacillus keqinensis]|uniref:DUF3139 domain-containing protein n=1 Tax=Salipaludibacillus keqinensis TaxID=2045207 RepID=A0A323TV99_9BACI|nr:hypothetical protein [Salipaludibacillus keqinensis]PYZ93425.1 hypothetical protein CR194_09625 [Salipaludibacillus keqinensis]